MNEDSKIKDLNSPGDFTLVREFQSGNKAAFDRLVLKHKNRLFNLCYRFLGDYQEAEDTSQDIFLKAYRSLNRFRLESSFSTWLFRIAINTCKNKVNSLGYRYSKKRVRIGNSEGDDDRYSIDPGDNTENPMTVLESKEKLKAIQAAIDSLPPDQREIVILRDIEGFSYEEIADITGSRLGTLKSRLSRARLGLRKKLGSLI